MQKNCITPQRGFHTGGKHPRIHLQGAYIRGRRLLPSRHYFVCAFFLMFLLATALSKPVRAAIPVMKITAFDWGTSSTIPSGDAVLVQSGSSYLLMDTQRNASCNQVISYLKKHGIRRLDLYLSHWHLDHYAYIATILRDHYFKVGTLYLPPSDWVAGASRSDGRAVNTILAAARKSGTKVRYLRKGMTFKIGKATARVLWYGSPFKNRKAYSKYVNNHSVLTKITVDGISYLTGGDLLAQTEKQILAAKVDVRADIYKLSHHGEGDSEAFIKAVAPTYTFYMTGKEKKNTMDLKEGDGRTFASRLSHLFGVRRNGNITFSIYPKGTKTRIKVEAQRNITKKTVKGKTIYMSK